MSDVENAKANAEAKKSVGTSSSTSRARLWAGLNRYLASEAQHEHKLARKERDEAERRRERTEDRRTGGKDRRTGDETR